MGRLPGQALTSDNNIWALKQLGVSGDASEEEINRAFRSFIKRVHPDTGGDHDHAAQMISDAKRARDMLLRQKKETCPMCDGRGFGRAFLAGTCPKCRGQGVIET